MQGDLPLPMQRTATYGYLHWHRKARSHHRPARSRHTTVRGRVAWAEGTEAQSTYILTYILPYSKPLHRCFSFHACAIRTIFIMMHDDFAQPFIRGQMDRYDAVPAGSMESPPCAPVEQSGPAWMHVIPTGSRFFVSYAIASFHARGNECVQHRKSHVRGANSEAGRGRFRGNSCYFTRLGQFASLPGLDSFVHGDEGLLHTKGSPATGGRGLIRGARQVAQSCTVIFQSGRYYFSVQVVGSYNNALSTE